MKMRSLFVLVALTWSATVSADFRKFQAMPVDSAMESQLATIAEESFAEFAPIKLVPGNMAITMIDLTDPARPRRADFHGGENFYPASVVKLFYLVAAHEFARRGELRIDEPMLDGLKDMIVDSSNDATSYVVDRLTDSTSGGELHGRAFRKWFHKRGKMNRYFEALGYKVIVRQKTWCENVYGRERQGYGKDREHRNRVTTDSMASLMYWIVRREAVSPRASEAMLALMKRKVPADVPAGADAATLAAFSSEADYLPGGLPAGSRIWTKAGWTSEVRHDVGYVELPNGRRFIVAVASRHTDTEPVRFLPFVARKAVAMFE